MPDALTLWSLAVLVFGGLMYAATRSSYTVAAIRASATGCSGSSTSAAASG